MDIVCPFKEPFKEPLKNHCFMTFLSPRTHLQRENRMMALPSVVFIMVNSICLAEVLKKTRLVITFIPHHLLGLRSKEY